MQALHNQMVTMIHGIIDRREPWAAEFDLNRTAELLILYTLAMKAHASGAALTATKLLEEAFALCEKYDEDWAALKDGAVLEADPPEPQPKPYTLYGAIVPSESQAAPGDDFDDIDFDKV